MCVLYVCAYLAHPPTGFHLCRLQCCSFSSQTVVLSYSAYTPHSPFTHMQIIIRVITTIRQPHTHTYMQRHTWGLTFSRCRSRGRWDISHRWHRMLQAGCMNTHRTNTHHGRYTADQCWPCKCPSLWNNYSSRLTSQDSTDRTHIHNHHDLNKYIQTIIIWLEFTILKQLSNSKDTLWNTFSVIHYFSDKNMK